MTFCSAVDCAGSQHAAGAPAAPQASTVGSKLQVLLTMPSTRPSAASDWARIACCSAVHCAGGTAAFISGVVPAPGPVVSKKPCAAAAAENCCVFQASASQALGRSEPGSPATTPSNWSPKRCDTIIASRPPSEQPTK